MSVLERVRAGKVRGEDRGYGLHQLLNFIKLNDGELAIISGNGKVIFKKG